MRMGYEAMTEGVVKVRRPDAAELLAIRNGSMTYEELMDMAADLEAKIKTVEGKATLPTSVDLKRISELVVSVYEEHWKGKGTLLRHL